MIQIRLPTDHHIVRMLETSFLGIPLSKRQELFFAAGLYEFEPWGPGVRWRFEGDPQPWWTERDYWRFSGRWHDDGIPVSGGPSWRRVLYDKCIMNPGSAALRDELLKSTCPVK